jgi:SAM-dependent methyltransferase
MEAPRCYGTELAHLHHERFGDPARAAANELLTRLGRSGFVSGTVVDLGAGSGILSRIVSEAGFKVFGIDQSAEMLAIAREHAPAATLVQASIWEAELPPCVAATAVGEVLNYRSGDARPLASLFSRIYQALDRHGSFLFDLAGPGRSGPSGMRRATWTFGDTSLAMVEQEDVGQPCLTRRIAITVHDGDLVHRADEVHDLILHDPFAVADALGRAGFSVERLQAYGELELLPGWHAFAATKP